jgi:hypothetical protein
MSEPLCVIVAPCCGRLELDRKGRFEKWFVVQFTSQACRPMIRAVMQRSKIAGRCGAGLSLPISYMPRLQKGTERDASERIGLLKETEMPQNKHDPKPAEAGEQVPARPHDAGSTANETEDGLDTTTEALRHAAEDTPSGSGPGDVEKTPVFDRADLAPKI